MKYYHLKYNITPLTHVHIGSGEVMDPFRFLVKGGFAHLVDTNAYIAYLTQKDAAKFGQLIDNGIFRDLLEYIWAQFDTNNTSLYHFRYRVTNEVSELFQENIKREENQNLIQEYIRTGLYQPIIPGSSIKGSFRTALISALYDKDGRRKRGRDFEFQLLDAYNWKIKRPLIDDDPFKLLKFSDATLKNEDLDVKKVERVYVRKPQAPITFHAEAIKPSAEAVCQTTLSFSDVFMNHVAIAKILGRQGKPTEKFHALTATINSYHKSKLEKDIERIGVEQYKNIYDLVLRCFSSLRPGNFILRIGKGSGQNFLTVNNPALKLPVTKSLVDNQSMGWCMFTFTTK